jgi:hypothetical protein
MVILTELVCEKDEYVEPLYVGVPIAIVSVPVPIVSVVAEKLPDARVCALARLEIDS